MRKILNIIISFSVIGLAPIQADSTYIDSTGEIFWNNSAADIVKAEVSNTSTDLVFKVTLGGDLSANPSASHIIAFTKSGLYGTSYNPYFRPITFISPVAEMYYWIESGNNNSWEFWNYVGTGMMGPTFNGPSTPPGSSYTNVGNLLTYTIPLSELGIYSYSPPNQTIYFDIYSTRGMGTTDGPADALSNPNRITSTWGEGYTTGAGTPQALSYTLVPEPSALSLLAVGLGLVLRRSRRTI